MILRNYHIARAKKTEALAVGKMHVERKRRTRRIRLTVRALQIARTKIVLPRRRGRIARVPRPRRVVLRQKLFRNPEVFLRNIEFRVRLSHVVVLRNDGAVDFLPLLQYSPCLPTTPAQPAQTLTRSPPASSAESHVPNLKYVPSRQLPLAPLQPPALHHLPFQASRTDQHFPATRYPPQSRPQRIAGGADSEGAPRYAFRSAPRQGRPDSGNGTPHRKGVRPQYEPPSPDAARLRRCQNAAGLPRNRHRAVCAGIGEPWPCPRRHPEELRKRGRS